MKNGLLLFLVTVALLGCSDNDSSDDRARKAVAAAPGEAGAVNPAGREVTGRATRTHSSVAGMPDRGELMAYSDRGAGKRDGAYTWHQVAISEEHAFGALAEGRLRVQTPSGKTLEFVYDRHEETPSGDWTWVGHLPGQPGVQTILTFGARAVFGSIGQVGERPLRVTTRNGAAWIVETDSTLLQGIASAGANPTSPDYLAVPKTPRVPDSSASDPLASFAQTASATAAATTTIDVVIGYTSGFVTENGGASAVSTRLNYLVAVANQTLANSQVDASIRLVHSVLVNYPDNTSNESTLEQLTGYDVGEQRFTTPNAAFNALRTARETYGADLVTLVRGFRDPEQDGCGIAWLIGGGRTGISAGDDYFGYSVVSDGDDANENDGETYFCRDESFIHELGHNIGSQHDREAAEGGDGALDSEDYGIFTYSFGLKTVAGAGNFFTVMAYGDEGQTSYRVFSNPRITFCGGRSCGTTQFEDNARSIGQAAPLIAQFRASTVQEANDIAPGIVSSDINGDGRDDLFYRNGSSFVYWLMNGATMLDWKLYSVRADTRLAGYGDLDGNGRADLIWIRPSREVFIWLGTAGGFSYKFSHVHGSGWTMAGISDMNGDGRDDLLWYNPSSQALVVWYMNGSSRTSYRSFAVPAGYRFVASGDFDGDGLGDIVWDTAARALYVWTNSQTSFSSTYVRTYQDGWELIGTRDLDRDGRSDMQWHNQMEGRWVNWRMSGPTLVSYKVFAIGTSVQSNGTGDFNGDGYADMLWRNSARRLYMWQGGAGIQFTSRFVAQNGEGWSVIN